MADVVIPERLRSTSVAYIGDPARAWLLRLPEIVADLAAAWDLEVGPPYEPGGNFSWVAPVRRRTDDAALALKVQLPDPESDPEALALTAWAGHGAVRLEAHDPDRCGLLLERCEPGTPIGDEPDRAAALAEGVSLAVALHRVAPPAGVPELATVMSPCAERVADRRSLAPQVEDLLYDLAVDTLRSAGRALRSVLLHGDLNPTNVLRSGRGWLAIDPKPMVGDPAYDGARLILQTAPDEGPDPIVVIGERIRRTAGAFGVESDRLARWCLAEIVRGGTLATSTGDRTEGDRQLAILPWVVPWL